MASDIRPHPYRHRERERSPETTMTSFSVTCSRLSQYLKEKQRLTATSTRTPTTMSLLPGLDVPPDTEADISDQQPMDLFPQKAGLDLTPPAVEKAQLTIFYGGQMLVFDNIPADKAKVLMLMAGKGNSDDDPPAAAPVVGEAAALPFARRASLFRFIEKRRERIHLSKAVYKKVESRNTRLPCRH